MPIKAPPLYLPGLQAVRYRGKTVFDAAFYYCPYIPLQMSGIPVGELSTIAAKTRYSRSQILVEEKLYNEVFDDLYGVS
jgi:hypothetical protein